MNIKKTPTFTRPTQTLWDAIRPETRKLLLGNVWCSSCRREITITNFNGGDRSGDFLVVGKCSECQEDIAELMKCIREKVEAWSVIAKHASAWSDNFHSEGCYVAGSCHSPIAARNYRCVEES